MEKELTEDEIVKIYSDAINFRLYHRLLFFLASLSIGFWFLCPILYGNELPNWVLFVIFTIILIWMIVTLPRHFVAILKDDRLRIIYFNPLLSSRCAIRSLKPTKEDSKKYIGLNFLFYLSLFIPIISIFILITFLFIKKP